MDLVYCMKTDDKYHWYMLLFRAFDYDRSKTLEPSEIEALSIFIKKQISLEEAKALCKSEGDGESLTFAQYYKHFTGNEVDANIDPYEGNLKTGCCILL
uniref:EF-hand family protein n=1 Tax=Coptotermes formosanus TaxID=36987 RepID=R4V2H2_COPFO|nr:EF-hand family protein [Coptotermes formosanus]